MESYRGKKPMIGDQVYIAEGARLIGQVTIGDQASVWYNAVLRGDINRIEIGARTNVQDNTTIHVGHDQATLIGEDVTIGHNCIIHGCTIGEGSLIGMGSIILDGAVIGKNCLVGAGSMVTQNKTFEDGVMILGRPAKVFKKLTEEEIQGLLASATSYVNTALVYQMEKKII